MTKQYWVGGFFIDLSRNQITQNKQSQTIAPKALAVLTYLAENQGKVVSHDDLLDKVWPDTVVSPNTLQRSIAQLRKALGDDGKVQFYIKTHAKQGYSLECDVRWDDKINPTSPNKVVEIDQFSEADIDLDDDFTETPQPSRADFRLVSIIAGIIICCFIGYQLLKPQQHSPLTFDTLRSLTATDDKEFDGTYTPDGQHIVFHRYLDKLCVNKIWAKNITTQKETLLTKEWGAYGGHSFSKDGKKLIFLATEACNQPVTQKNCYDLVSLDFEKALETPQQPDIMLQCQNSTVKKPIWLNNNTIALLQRKSNRWKIINYSISNNNSTDLYEPTEGNLIDYTYSVKDDLIAVTSIHDDNQYYLKMIKPDGRVLSNHLIQYPQEIAKFRPIYPSFDPLNEQLIFSTGRQLFTLSYVGKVAKLNSPFSDRMSQPVFHPGGKRLLFIKGPYDNDVVLLPIDQLDKTSLFSQVEHTRTYPSFERSNLGEDHAIFQPGGDLIAFWSERSGEQQLWLSHGNNPQQLTHFPMDTYINGFDWAADGKSLIVNANGTLSQVFLDSNLQSFPLEYPVVRLFQWDSENHSALMILRINGIFTFVELDLNNLTFRVISEKPILWALKSEDGRLIYKDHLDQFWQPGPVESQLIQPLSNQGTKSKTFVMTGNVIYAINKDNQLWSYDLNDERFKLLGEVDKDIDYLTDVNESQLLMTIRVAAKKEVVELSLSE